MRATNDPIYPQAVAAVEAGGLVAMVAGTHEGDDCVHFIAAPLKSFPALAALAYSDEDSDRVLLAVHAIYYARTDAAREGIVLCRR